MKDFNLREYLIENKLLKEEMSLEVDEEGGVATISSNSGQYSGFIEDNNTVDFSVVYDDEDDRDGMEFDEDNWKDILGPEHAFIKISNQIPTEVEALGDYVMITVDVEDLKGIADKVSITKSDDFLDSPAAGNIEATYSKPGGPVFKSYSDFQDYYK